MNLHDTLGELARRRVAVPGGCDHCNAEQTVAHHPRLKGMWKLTVHHDHDCPWLAAHEREGPSAASEAGR